MASNLQTGRRLVSALAASSLVVVFSAPIAFADPPPWAPAHGWRHHHKGEHEDQVEYRRHEVIVEQNSAIVAGGCNRNLVAATFSDSTANVLGSLIGGAAGGLIGNQFGKGSGKTAMTVLGAVAGVLIGGAIGRSMDPEDQGCVGQALEHSPDRHPVVWQNPSSGAQYQVTPVSTYEPQPGVYCREYTSQAVIAGKRDQVTGTACRQPDGSWRIQS
jgi:surface antigen